MKKYIFILIITLLLSSCQSIDPILKGESKVKKSGAYYLDDGPDKNPPENLETIKDAQPKYESLSKTANRPYVAFDKRYTPMKKIIPFKEEGYASWYGKRYHGRKTSIGETYDMYQMTGAHKTLPLPCYIKVTNLKNQRSVVIRVNDRGPFIDKRIVDLSYAAAHRLDIIKNGSELVKIEMINPSSRKENLKKIHNDSLTLTSNKYFYIQAGAFSSEENATNLMNRITRIKFKDSLSLKKVNKDSLHLVTIGPYESKEIAKKSLKKILKKIQLNSFIISN